MRPLPDGYPITVGALSLVQAVAMTVALGVTRGAVLGRGNRRADVTAIASCGRS